jgi:hypothetical protein
MRKKPVPNIRERLSVRTAMHTHMSVRVSPEAENGGWVEPFAKPINSTAAMGFTESIG